MKVIKLRALEEFFEAKITKIRSDQLGFLKKFYFINVYFIGLIQIAPIAMPIGVELLTNSGIYYLCNNE
jgi:hypothetical protein